MLDTEKKIVKVANHVDIFLKKFLKKSIHSTIIQIKDSIVNTIDLNHIIYF